MPNAHARLAPSAAERWLACPASVRMEAKVGSSTSDSVFAAEGTSAHALGEIEVSRAFGLVTHEQADMLRAIWKEEAEHAGFDVVEIAIHIEAYVQFVRERASLYPMANVVVEQRLDTGVPACWGTSDVVICAPTAIEVVDLKYGQGLWVQAAGNPQLRLYALGALDTFGDLLGEVETVTVTVFQPRLGNYGSETLAAAELREWRETVIPIAQLALGDDAPFGPSDEACRWCPASGICKAQMEWATARDFAQDPDLLDEWEMAEALRMLPVVRSWANAVEAKALDLTYSQQRAIPGWKVVMSGGKRQVQDSVAAVTKLLSLGFTEDQISKKTLRGIGELESLLRTLPKVGRRFAKLDDVLGDLVTKTEGRPSLVPEDDKREAASPNAEAAKEFSDE